MDQIGVCYGTHHAPAGLSDIGSVPFLVGLQSAVGGVGDFLGGRGGWFSSIVSATLSIIFAPFGWFIGLFGVVAGVLVFLLEGLFRPIAYILSAFTLPIDPLLVSAALLIVLIRAALLPLVLRNGRRIVRDAFNGVAERVQMVRKQFPDDKKRQAAEMQRVQRELGHNPLAGCLSIVPTLIVVPAVWRLFQGLTTRSESGTFAPFFVEPNSALGAYLSQSKQLATFSMDLTVTLPAVGWCSRLLPYVVTLIILIAVTYFFQSSLWRHYPEYLKRGARVAGFVIIFGYLFLPTLFLLLRLVDTLFIFLQFKYIENKKRAYGLELQKQSRHDLEWDHD